MALLRINEGNSYTVASTYVDPNGNYEVFRVKDDAGKNEIACFVNEKFRPTNLTSGDKVAVKRITGVTLGWKKKKKYSKEAGGYVEGWVQEFAVTVDAVKVANDLDDVDSWIDEVEGAALPWDGDLPV